MHENIEQGPGYHRETIQLGARLSQHLEPSRTVGTQAQTGCHLPGMRKQELLFQVWGSASPLRLPQLIDSLMQRFQKLSLFCQLLLRLTLKCQSLSSSFILYTSPYYFTHDACFNHANKSKVLHSVPEFFPELQIHICDVSYPCHWSWEYLV